ncbi:hypothetical protein G7046_g6541 [Stylonectria norvegica]|nr:hypothetical protein G7046_g6541 [Stylonectria norvegica]
MLSNIAILSILAFSGVQCHPTSSPPSTADAHLTRRFAELICSANIETPSGAICNQEGYIDKQGAVIDRGTRTLQECVDHCAASDGCTSFFHNKGNDCVIYSGALSSYGLVPYRTGTFFWEKDCFHCTNGVSALNLDFEDSDISHWELTTPADDTFFMDIQTPFSAEGGMSPALRIMENTASGHASASYMYPISLEKGKYRVGFNTKSTLIPSPTGGNNWSLLTITVSGGGGNLYNGAPENGISLGNGWFRFEMEFDVAEDVGGSSFLDIGLDASGQMLDWYFDDIYIVSVQ